MSDDDLVLTFKLGALATIGIWLHVGLAMAGIVPWVWP